MNGMKALLENRLANAKKAHCWRVVCARIRDIAKLQEADGVPYGRTLEEYNYEFYHRKVY